MSTRAWFGMGGWEAELTLKRIKHHRKTVNIIFIHRNRGECME